jgi:hypothetical protein
MEQRLIEVGLQKMMVSDMMFDMMFDMMIYKILNDSKIIFQKLEMVNYYNNLNK